VRVRESSRTYPPAFSGQLRQEGADTVLAGEVRETVAGRLWDGAFVGLTAFLALVALLLAVFDLRGGAVGIAVCGVGALLFLGVVLLNRKVRGPAFAGQVDAYRYLLTARLGIEPPSRVLDGVGADQPELDDDGRRRLAAAALPLLEKLRTGASLRECAAEAAALTDLFAAEGLSPAEARLAVDALAHEFEQSPPREQGEIVLQLQADSQGA
jgi:hypothetical protein